MLPPDDEEDDARPLPVLLAAADDVIEAVSTLLLGEDPLPPEWTMAQRYAIEEFAQAAARLIIRFAGATAFPIEERSLPGVFHLLPPADDEAYRCGAPTRTTGMPCRITVGVPGEHCQHHGGDW